MKLKVISQSGTMHTASVIFLHGSGDTGSNLTEWVRFLLGTDMSFNHIRVVYPTAPLQPYTPLNGQNSNVWFDRRSISIEALENRTSMASIYKKVNHLIQEETKLGIPESRIIIGGFSMGGALALHAGYHINTKIAGVFACSSFLNRGSIVYDSLRHGKKTGQILPELRMFHGVRDTLVPIQWGQETFDELMALGVNGNFISLENTLHELKKNELLDIKEWILAKLPMINTNLSGHIINKL